MKKLVFFLIALSLAEFALLGCKKFDAKTETTNADETLVAKQTTTDNANANVVRANLDDAREKASDAEPETPSVAPDDAADGYDRDSAFRVLAEKARDSDDDFIKALEAIEETLNKTDGSESNAMATLDELKKLVEARGRQLYERSEKARAAFEEALEKTIDSWPDSWSLRYRVVDEFAEFGALNVRNQVPDDVPEKDRARVRKLQRLAEILPLVDKAPDVNENYSEGGCAYRSNYYLKMIELFGSPTVRASRPTVNPYARLRRLRLQNRTPLTADDRARYVSDVRKDDLKYTPYGPDGEPLFYRAPESFESAQNDGERVEFLLEKLKSVADAEKRVEFERVHDSISVFGVATLGDLTPEEIKLLSDLNDSQTIVRLPSGSRIVDLPEEYAFIPTLRRSLGSSRNALYANSLMLETEFQARRQTDKLKELYEQIANLEDATDSEKANARAKRRALDDIGVVFDVDSTSVKGSDAQFALKFRNRPDKVEFVFKEIDVDKIVAEYANEAPDLFNANPSFYGDAQSALLDDLNDKVDAKPNVLGNEVARFTVDLDANASDALVVKLADYATVAPGAYYVEAIATRGDKEESARAWFVPQEVSLALSRGGGEGASYQLECVDARTGEPKSGAKIELVGLSFSMRLVQGRIGLESRYWRSSVSVTLTTDERGIVRLGRDEFQALGFYERSDDVNERARVHFTLAIARDDDGKFLGALDFAPIYPPSDKKSSERIFLDHPSPLPILRSFPTDASYAVFDQPFYRPGQTARFALFRQKLDDLDVESRKSTLEINYQIPDPKAPQRLTVKRDYVRGAVSEDEFGVLSGSFTIPEIAEGELSVAFMNRGEIGRITVVPDRPQAKIELDAPSDDVERDSVVNIPIRAFEPSGAPATNRIIHCLVGIRPDFNRDANPDAPWNWYYGAGYDRTDLAVDDNYVRDGFIPLYAPIKPLFVDSSFEENYQLETDAEGRATLALDLGKFGRLDPATPYRVALRASLAKRYSVDWFVENDAEVDAVFRLPNVDASDSAPRPQGALELVRDRADYAPGDVARVEITSVRPDAVVYLTPRASFGALDDETQIVRLENGRAEVEIPIRPDDSPNVILSATTVFDGKRRSALLELPVPPRDRLLEGALEIKKDGEYADVVVKIDPNDSARKRVYFSVYDLPLENARGAYRYDKSREAFVKWSRYASFAGFLAREQANFASIVDLRRAESEEAVGGVKTTQKSPFLIKTRESISGKREKDDSEKTTLSVLDLPQRYRGESRPAFRRAGYMGGGRVKYDFSNVAPDALDPATLEPRATTPLTPVDVDSDGEARIVVPLAGLNASQRVRAWFLDDKGRVGQVEGEIPLDEDAE